MNPALALLRRDVLLALRSGGSTVEALIFFLIVIVLVPLGTGPDADILRALAPGTLWLAALVACLLSLDRLFQADFEDGSLDALALSPLPLEAIVALKALAHWITTGLPLTLIAPLLALMLNLAPDRLVWLLLGLLAGTPALSFIGAIGAALTLGLRRGGLLIGILTLPLYIPTLIFGARTMADAPLPALALTFALTLFVLALSPFATARILRIQMR